MDDVQAYCRGLSSKLPVGNIEAGAAINRRTFNRKLDRYAVPMFRGANQKGVGRMRSGHRFRLVLASFYGRVWVGGRHPTGTTGRPQRGQ